jgi:paraquat-inducible protein A
MGSVSSHTILGGVIELWHMGSWDIALVVFIASVVVPLFKLIALGVLVFLTQQRAGIKLRERTHMYVIVEFIGQWSMLDVFVVILLSALGHFGSLLSIQPGGGAAAFGGVVILTMLAAMGFDPRLAWRLAGHRKHLSRGDLESTH